MRHLILPLILLTEIALFSFYGEQSFETWLAWGEHFRYYLTDLLAQAAPILCLSLGMTMVMTTSGIDLSVGSAVTLVAAVMARFDAGASFWGTAVPTGLLMGVGLGAFNGALIALCDIPPIIATLGSMILFRGLCYVVLGDQELAPFWDVPGYAWFGEWPGAVVLAASVVLLGGTYLKHSTWYRELTVVGGNRIAARYAGIPVTSRLVQVYALMGLTTFLAALCFTARNGSVNAGMLAGLELEVIVAVVLGGTKVEGGYSSLFGSMWGVLIMAVMNEGLRNLAWQSQDLPFELSHLRFVVIGLLLVIGVWLNSIRRG
ncbi:MAG: ABC transporter permease [Planctomycetaceae bacterium]